MSLKKFIATKFDYDVSGLGAYVDEQREDLIEKGYSHFVSASYVHHIGSNTIGFDGKQLHQDAMPWLLENRPEYAKAWFR